MDLIGGERSWGRSTDFQEQIETALPLGGTAPPTSLSQTEGINTGSRDTLPPDVQSLRMDAGTRPTDGGRWIMESVCFSEARRQFAARLATDGLSGATVAGYDFNLGQFAAWMVAMGLGDPPVIDLVRSHVRAFLDWAAAGGYETAQGHVAKPASAKTRNRIIAALRTFFAFCQDQEWLAQSPAATIRCVKTPERLPQYWTEEQVAAFLAEIERDGRGDSFNGVRDWCMFALLVNTGLRVGELFGDSFSPDPLRRHGLLLSQIDLDAARIRVIGKGNREETVPLNDMAEEAIRRWLARRGFHPGPLFLKEDGSPLGPQGVRLRMRRYGAPAGIPRPLLTPHKLRHTFATMMAAHGVDVLTIMGLLRHKNLNTTQVYTHVQDRAKREAVAALPFGQIRPVPVSEKISQQTT